MTEITPKLFDLQMDRISSTFGPKNYRIDRVELIWNLAQLVWYEDFCKIINHFISTFRHAPLPKDFSEAIRAERKQYAAPVEQVVIEAIRCLMCTDMGMIRVLGKYDNTDVLMRCDCKAGTKQDWNVPQWISECNSMFTRAKCPLEWFKPTDPTSLSKNIKEHQLVKAWRNRIRESEKYFQINIDKHK